jgi:RHS repeat-associated protein
VGSSVLATSYSYDDANRLDVVTDPTARAYDHGYDANGNRKSLTYPNGVVTAYTYNDLNRLTDLTTTHSPSGITIQSYALTLGPSGNRTRVGEGDGTVREYGYDGGYRLISEKVTLDGLLQYEKGFTYDDVGNRLTQSTTGTGNSGTAASGAIAYGYDTRDRMRSETLGSAPPTEYRYDLNGNLVTKEGEASYTWDIENRLVKVTKTDGTTVEHVYDADGVRVRSTTTLSGGGGETVDYLVDTPGALSHVVAESDGTTGDLKTYYVRSDGELLAVMRPSNGGLSTRFYDADGTGSVRRLTDESGAITDRYSYTAFGELLGHTGTDPQPYAFSGEPYDPNVGFQYHRARWMDPRTGQFLGMDPWDGDIFEPSSLHRYTYAASDPVNRRDPSGRFSLGEMAAVSVIVGVVFAIVNSIHTVIKGGMQSEIYKSYAKGFLLGAGVAGSVYLVVWAGVMAYLAYASPFGIPAAYELSRYSQNGTAIVLKLRADIVVQRWFSGLDRMSRPWWTTEFYTSASEASQKLALPVENLATRVVTGLIPRGTEIVISFAARLGSLPGGGIRSTLIPRTFTSSGTDVDRPRGLFGEKDEPQDVPGAVIHIVEGGIR